MTHSDWWSDVHAIPGGIAPTEKPRERIWTLRRGHHTYVRELVGHGEYGWETQVLKDGEFLWGSLLEPVGRLPFTL